MISKALKISGLRGALAECNCSATTQANLSERPCRMVYAARLRLKTLAKPKGRSPAPGSGHLQQTFATLQPLDLEQPSVDVLRLTHCGNER